MRKSLQIINGFQILLLALLIGYSQTCDWIQTGSSGWDKVPEILKNIRPPDFPDRDFIITDFGAIGDANFDCTDAFRKVIKSCHDAGGGYVIVPAGTYLTGAIHLQDNVCLHIDSAATILFSQDPRKYLPVVFTRFEGLECMNYSPFIYAFDKENIAITGKGTLDGQADTSCWWTWAGNTVYGWRQNSPCQITDRNTLMQMVEENTPVQNRIFGEGHFLRPSFIQFYRSKNILVEGINIKRSPMWEIHPVLCENVTVRNINIDTHGPNNDGCNPESSKNVLISNCRFDTGDDCIAIKSGRNGDGRRINVPSENIIIRDCVMRDGHGGVVIGSEISGNCRNVFAENCRMDSPNLERAFRIKTNSLRGGIVENIYMRKVIIGKVSDAIIRINFQYEEGDVGSYTPIVRNIYINDIISHESMYALALDGYARSPISNVQLENCQFNGVKETNILNNVSGLKMKNTSINGILQGQ